MTVSRRTLILSPLALAACRPPLAKRFRGYAFVANRGSHSVAVVNLTQFKVEKQIPLAAAPDAVIADRSGSRAFVLTPDDGNVTEMTAASSGITRRKKVAGAAVSMKLSSAGDVLWLLCREPRALVPLDLERWETSRAVMLPSHVSDFDLAPDGMGAAVSFSGAKRAALVDLKSRALSGEIELASQPGVIRFRPDGKQVLIGSAEGRVVAVADARTGRLLVNLPVAVGPERFCFSTDHGGQMFCTGLGMDAVAIVYPYQTEVSETILAGREPGAMAVNATHLFVANPPTGDVTVIEIAERRVVAKFETGEEPCSITLTPDGEYGLVLNRKSGDMAVIRLSKMTDLRYKRAPLFTLIAVGNQPVSAAVCRL
ncbi:MAG: hypothetical protein M3Z09_10325 [Acidobacteriota bacterium]|nr:hypothetical protein [Acidobacteriota bacterium]